MFNKYYQDELTFLREMGAEFARANPKMANLLSDRSADPDVERLLEGFSFLSGQIRQKIDDELPELTHTLLGLLWPHYLRPVPSMTIVEFQPGPEVDGLMTIGRGVSLDSPPIDGTACRFRTCYDVELAPLTLTEAAIEAPMSAAHCLRLRLSTLNGVDLKKLGLTRLRLHIYGDPHISYEAFLRLRRHVVRVIVQAIVGGRPQRRFELHPSCIKPVGFAPGEAILPYPDHAFPGYRLLQEYFALPEKFLFVDVEGLAPLADLGAEDTFEILFEFDRPGQTSLPVTAGNFLLHCTPAVNLFAHEADPIRVDQTRTEYRVRPAGENLDHYEIYSIEEVAGFIPGSAERIIYEPFFAFTHHADGERKGRGYHQTRVRNMPRPREEDEEIEAYQLAIQRMATVGHGTDTWLSFVAPDQSVAVPLAETISVALTCTNRHLPERLNVGDVRVPTADSPEFAQFRNIYKPISSVHPPLDGGLHWRLISHLSLNFVSLISVEALRGILELYNLQAYYDQQAARENEQRLSGVRSVEMRPSEWIYHGAPIRGRSILITMDEDHYAGEGDMYLLADVLSEFFALYASLNSFTQLTVRGIRRGEVYQWPRRLGRQIVL
ncbi:MAG: type VI secretion system baseplate subunit TssF [bacterium]|nr:type VI secretion system baseplate subunit TssF [bacterium]